MVRTVPNSSVMRRKNVGDQPVPVTFHYQPVLTSGDRATRRLLLSGLFQELEKRYGQAMVVFADRLSVSGQSVEGEIQPDQIETLTKALNKSQIRVDVCTPRRLV